MTRTIDVLVTICVQTMRDPERVASHGVPVLTVCVAKGHPIIEVYRYLAHSAYEVHAFSKLERDDDGR